MNLCLQDISDERWTNLNANFGIMAVVVSPFHLNTIIYVVNVNAECSIMFHTFYDLLRVKGA